ncbi:unnamed protein product [Allacma fusca]|nr:unnamed protein product [Allacma fusca]
MKPEWKILEQLTCHAEIEGSGGDEALRNFKDKYEYKTVCIELRGMMPKKRIYNGISMRVKCCRVCFYDEQAEVNSVDGF